MPNLDALAALQRVNIEFEVLDNPTLPTCEVEALRARVGTGPNLHVETSGNDDDATCP